MVRTIQTETKRASDLPLAAELPEPRTRDDRAVLYLAIRESGMFRLALEVAARIA